MSISHASEKKYFQILHTNDLHSFFENAMGRHTDKGGYAQLKFQLDQEKIKGLQLRRPTLAFDAGDFLEGSLFYLANKGEFVMKIMEAMNYDAIVMGNHDWLMGTQELNDLIERTNPQLSLLGANILPQKILYPRLIRNILPYKIFQIHSKKIAVMGLTTNQIIYSWTFKNYLIQDPIKIGKKLAEYLKLKLNVDYLVALTHIGLSEDKRLVQASPHIDLVIGGHDHKLLEQPHWEVNSQKRKIPIVQVGDRGMYYGKILLEINETQENKAIQVAQYEVKEILQKFPQDNKVKEIVQEAREDLENFYGKDWLNEAVSYSEIPLENSGKRMTPWTQLVTETLRESVGSDISFHSPHLAGIDLPRGQLTRKSLFHSFPRAFSLEDSYGWKVWKVEMRGVYLYFLIKYIVENQISIAVNGVEFDLVKKNNFFQSLEELKKKLLELAKDETGLSSQEMEALSSFLGKKSKYKIKNIKVGGKPLELLKKYTVALPEGIVMGGSQLHWATRKLFSSFKKSDMSIWLALNQKVKKMGVITDPHKKTTLKPLSPTLFYQFREGP